MTASLFLLAAIPTGVFTAVIAAGAVIGVFGHIVHSRTLILTGILVIGLTSAYFSFVLQPH